MFERFLIILIISTIFINNANSASHGRYKRKQTDSVKSCPYEICDDVDNYPNESIMDNLIAKEDSLKSFFGKIIEPHQEIVIGNRDNFDGPEGLCVVRQVTKEPKYLEDLSGDRKYIVNTKEHRQTIVFEVCDKPGDSCFDVGALSKSTYCVQKYTVIKLVTLNSNQTLSYSRFRIPSTCVCSYKEQCKGPDCE